MQYAIVNTSAIQALTKEQQDTLFSELCQDSLTTMRKSADGTKCVVKWCGAICPLDQFAIPYTGYDDVKIAPAGIVAELEKAEWDNSIEV